MVPLTPGDTVVGQNEETSPLENWLLKLQVPSHSAAAESLKVDSDPEVDSEWSSVHNKCFETTFAHDVCMWESGHYCCEPLSALQWDKSLRQCTEASGRISHFSWAKVASDLVKITVFSSDIVIDVIEHRHTAKALLSQTAENNEW